MKATEKIKKIAAAWRERKGSGGDVIGGGIGSDVGQVVDSIGSLFGLGLAAPVETSKTKKKNEQKESKRQCHCRWRYWIRCGTCS